MRASREYMQGLRRPMAPLGMATSGVGGRVAEERKLAGLTQAQLATRAHVSTSLIKAVEQGRLPASPAFVSAVSRALDVGVPDLLDQPFPRESRADHRIHATVPAIRRELASYTLPPGDTVRPRALPELPRPSLRHPGYVTRSICTDAALCLWGQLHLKSGLAAARAVHRQTADDHLAEARDAAAHVAPDRDDYRLAFGSESVTIWSVGLAVEMADGTEAVQRAAPFTPPIHAPRERVGHYWMDLARGWLLHGNREQTLTCLIRARHTAPQQTRYHPMVHETVRVLARQGRRRSDTIQGFATWCGLS